VWISEIMLQQTRVEAVIPYYRRFLDRFPSLESLAEAPGNDVLAAWSGLGYYSRARNLHRAAKILARQGLPANYDQLAALPGVGPYTAAAIASIALGLNHAAVDGNVIRVISRITNDASEITSPAARRRFTEHAQALLDPHRPGDFNQAMMELGATICLPRTPACEVCPVEKLCAARAAGVERDLPVKLPKQPARDLHLDLMLIEEGSRIFLIRRSSAERRLADFWELPGQELFPGVLCARVCAFQHRIVNDRFHVTVWRPAAQSAQAWQLTGGSWFEAAELSRIPLTTVTKKALTSRENVAAAGL
jgi:A/G-specific adenine glycosylase